MKFRSQKSSFAGGNSRLAEIIKNQRGFIPFTGEEMICVLCGATQKSDVNVSYGWRCWVIDGKEGFYVCPKELPPEYAANATQAFTDVYIRAFKAYVDAHENYQPAKRVTVWIEKGGKIMSLN
jgi:hypothetical protein